MSQDIDALLDENDLEFSSSNLAFPQKLFSLLESDDSNTIQWIPNGYCFKITDTDKFTKEIMPKYFKQTKLTSFQRQLNLYGFRRLAKGEDQGAYFHPKFQKHRKDLLPEVKRLPSKGTLSTYEQVLSEAKYENEMGKRRLEENSGSSSNNLNSKKSLLMYPSSDTPGVIPGMSILAPYTLDQLRRQIELSQQYDSQGFVYPAPSVSKLTLNVSKGRNINFVPTFRNPAVQTQQTNIQNSNNSDMEIPDSLQDSDQQQYYYQIPFQPNNSIQENNNNSDFRFPDQSYDNIPRSYPNYSNARDNRSSNASQYSSQQSSQNASTSDQISSLTNSKSGNESYSIQGNSTDEMEFTDTQSPSQSKTLMNSYSHLKNNLTKQVRHETTTSALSTNPSDSNNHNTNVSNNNNYQCDDSGYSYSYITSFDEPN